MRRKNIILLTALLMLITATAGWSGDAPTLLVVDYSSQQILHEMPLTYGQPFTIRYIHSVDRTPVFEVFEARKGQGLVLKETYFSMFGAGMGHWEGHGEVVQEGPWTKIREINRPLDTFILRVGSPEVDHTLLVNGKEYHLSQSVPGRRVVVRVSEE